MNVDQFAFNDEKEKQMPLLALFTVAKVRLVTKLCLMTSFVCFIRISHHGHVQSCDALFFLAAI